MGLGTTHKLKTSSCKAKGRRLQDTVVRELRRKYGAKCTECQTFPPSGRGGDCKHPGELEMANISPAIMGTSGRDILLSPAAEAMIPFDIECKNTETASPWSWMKQAKANTKPGRKPLVCFTRNREGDVYAMLRLDDLLELL